MGRLHRTAGKFDNMVAVDAYNPATTFMVQFDALSYSKIDGVAVKKRALSLTPDVVLPPRGALAIDGETYLFGHPAPDYWDGKVIRNSLIIQGADGLSTLLSIEQALANTAGVSAYAALAFNKYSTDTRDSSEYHPEYQVFLAGNENAPAGSLVNLGSDWYLVKQSYISTSGLRISLSNKLDGVPFETVTVASQTYDPVTDTYGGATASAKVMRLRWTEHFQYFVKSQEDHLRGDETVFVLQSAFAAKPSDTLTLSDGVWRVISVVDEGNTLALHTRRA